MHMTMRKLNLKRSVHYFVVGNNISELTNEESLLPRCKYCSIKKSQSRTTRAVGLREQIECQHSQSLWFHTRKLGKNKALLIQMAWLQSLALVETQRRG